MTRCHGAYYDGVLRVICAGSPEIVLIAGELDVSNCLGLVSALDDLVDREGDVHVNLAGLTYCDVAGLRAILRLAGTGRGGEGHGGTAFLGRRERLRPQRLPSRLERGDPGMLIRGRSSGRS